MRVVDGARQKQKLKSLVLIAKNYFRDQPLEKNNFGTVFRANIFVEHVRYDSMSGTTTSFLQVLEIYLVKIYSSLQNLLL